MTFAASAIRLAAALAFAALAAGPGFAQDAPPAAAPAPTPVVVPVPEIASQAEATQARMRAVQASLEPSAELKSIEQAATAAQARITARARDHVAAIQAGPALRALGRMTASWQSERSLLESWGKTLTAYANEQERQIQELSALTESWSATLEQARDANAPPTVVERVQETITAIRNTRRDVERYRASILALQDRVAREISACDEAIDRIARYRKEEVGRVLVRNTQPLLGALFVPSSDGSSLEAIRNALRDEIATLPDFVRRASPFLALQAVLLVLLAATFRKAQQRAKTWVENDAALDRAVRVFSFPYSAAVLVTILTANWFYPWAPHLVMQAIGVVAVIPVTRVVRALVRPRLRPLVLVLAGLYLIDRVRDLVAPVPALEQTLLLSEMAIGIVALLWMLRRGALRATDDDDERDPVPSLAVTFGTRIVLAAFAIALVSGLAGYMRLAHFVGGGVLISAYLAAALVACVRALDGLVAYALRARPLRHLRMVRRHRPLLQTQVWRVLRWLGAAAWAAAVLYQFQLLEMLVEWLRAALTATISFGALSVTLGDLLAFALTVWLSFLLSRFVRFVLDEDVFPKVELPRGVPYAVSNLVHYLILICGTLLAFAAMGLDLNRFTILAGALGVGVGFGLQNVVNNFVSGLILLFERPIQVGDIVKIDQTNGEVKRIGIRSSTVRTGEGAEVIVPNATLIAQPVTNWTLTDRTRRVTIEVKVPYGPDPGAVLALLLAIASEHERVMQHPAPSAQFARFGDTAMEFTLDAWVGRLEEHAKVRTELALEVYRRLHAAGFGVGTVAPKPPADGSTPQA